MARAAVLATGVVLALAATAAQPATTSAKAPARQQAQRLTASEADVEFALATVASAMKQYAALPDAKKRKLEAKVAKAAGVKDVVLVSKTLRAMAAMSATKPAAKESREAVRQFLNANQKWCGAVKAARLARQAMAKLGMDGEMSLDDMLELLPE